MEANKVDFAKLNEAVEKFGSLQKTNVQLEKYKLALEKANAQLKQENKYLAETRDKLSDVVNEIYAKYQDYQIQLQSLVDKIKVYSYQYELFCGFMAMVTESPSVIDSIDNLINIFLAFKKHGWYLQKNPDIMISLFIKAVMGDHLKCYRCDACGAKFIINKNPSDNYLGIGYYCPACHYWYAIKPDDSFLKAMVSEQQLENTLCLEKVLVEYEKLLPLKALLKEPCEICHKPVTEWDEYNVKLLIQGTGCGHSSCWKSDLGRMKELQKAIEQVKKT